MTEELRDEEIEAIILKWNQSGIISGTGNEINKIEDEIIRLFRNRQIRDLKALKRKVEVRIKKKESNITQWKKESQDSTIVKRGIESNISGIAALQEVLSLIIDPALQKQKESKAA